MKSRIEREKVTIGHMIRIYCHHHHHPEEILCDDCRGLLVYAHQRVDKCIFGADKPVCAECKVHCYNKDMREKVKEVMRFAGPRMLFRHPLLAIKHMIDKL
jgi:hypothetical protein